MRSADRAAHDQVSARDRTALLTFVDACQIFVGRVDENPGESTALMRLLLMRALQRTSRPSAAHRTTNFRVGRVMSYLEQTFADPTVRLMSAARHVDVTPSHLDVLLREHTGQTFLQQLRRIRMRHAERLLLTTASSIKQTAYACGYASTGSFGRDFRRAHGCAPRLWRDLRTMLSAQFD
jgi:transcriptional regulator GlxA family with amidase domain